MTEPDVDKMTFGEYVKYCDDLHVAENKVLDQKGELMFKRLMCGDWFIRLDGFSLEPPEICVKSYMEIGGVSMAVLTSLKQGKSQVWMCDNDPVKLVEKPEYLK
jgi:hypothetical protein